MEIRRWQVYVVVSCVLVTHLAAKPVSLNELIAAESKQKEKQHSTPTGTKSTTAVSANERNKQNEQSIRSKPKDKLSNKRTKSPKTVSLNELIAAESKKQKEESQTTGLRKTSKPLSSKESSPSESRQNLERRRFPNILFPQKKSFSLKELFAARKQRIESLFSKTPGSGLRAHRSKLFPTLSQKPFESSDIFSLAKTIKPLKFRKRFEIRSPLKPKKIKYSFVPRQKRRNQSTKREAENEVFNRYIPLIKRIGLLVDDILTPESSESIEPVRRRKPRRNPKLPKTKTTLESSESEPQETTTAAPTTIPEVFEAENTTSEATDTTTYTSASSNLNTIRPDQDLPLSPSRNSSSDRGDFVGISEGSGPAFHRDDKGHLTRNNGSDEYNSGGRKQTYPSSDEENSCGPARVDKCGNGNTNGTRYTNIYKNIQEAETANGFVRRNDTERKNIFQIGGDQEALQIPRDVRRLPGLPDKVIIVDAQPVSPEKPGKESVINVPYDHANVERRTEQYGTLTTEDKRLRQVIQGMIPIDELIRPNFFKQNNQVVTIFDGYSVARDINGRNKLTEKAIRISPN